MNENEQFTIHTVTPFKMVLVSHVTPATFSTRENKGWQTSTDRAAQKSHHSRMGMYAARTALQSFCGEEFTGEDFDAQYTFSHSVHGRPILIKKISDLWGESNFSISIAHTKNIAAAAVAHLGTEGYVGIDVEYVREFPENTIEAFCTNEELHLLKEYEGQKAHIATVLWCLKEAYLKTIGFGLRIHPKRIAFRHIYDATRIALFHDEKKVPASIAWTTYENNCILSHVILRKESAPMFAR